jgi:hypothetical protein
MEDLHSRLFRAKENMLLLHQWPVCKPLESNQILPGFNRTLRPRKLGLRKIEVVGVEPTYVSM